MQKGEIVALGVLLGLPFLVAALKHWWPEIARPFQSRDDQERLNAKGSVLLIFVAVLSYAALGTVGAALTGQPWLAVFCISIGGWAWAGLSEVEARYHLLEALEDYWR